MDYFYLAAVCVLFTFLGGFVTNRFVAPRVERLPWKMPAEFADADGRRHGRCGGVYDIMFRVLREDSDLNKGPEGERRMGRVYVVAGIDTGIGKTAVTGLMARSLMASGRDVITVKMVQTGNDGFSEDIAAHRAICGGVHYPEDDEGLTAPQIFKFPSSPLLAAGLEGRTVDLAAVSRAVAACAACHDIVLVEAAGGLHVPLTDELLTADYVAREGWPLILVTCGRLGSINHTLLTLEAAKARGIRVAGVVYNWFEGADPLIDRDTPETTRRYLVRWGLPPVVVRVPRLDFAGPYPAVDFSEIFA